MMMKVEPELGGMHSMQQQRCDSCRSAPCAFYCRADSAALCVACDADVHSANTLASRHRRVPMGAAVAAPASPAGGAFVVRPGGGVNSSWPIREGRRRYYDEDDVHGGEEEDEEEATSWLLLDPLKGSEGQAAPAYGDALVADFLDLGGAGEKQDASSKECRSSHEGSHELVVPGEQLPEQQCFTGETAYDAQNFHHGYGFGATFQRSYIRPTQHTTRSRTPPSPIGSDSLRPQVHGRGGGDGVGGGTASDSYAPAGPREGRR